LRDYARFLLEHHLDDFVQSTISRTRMHDTPMIRYLMSFSEPELGKTGRQITTELLTAFKEDQVDQYIKRTVERWLQDQLPMIERNQINIDDVYLFPHIRRQVLLEFIPNYTQEINTGLSLAKEIDEYTLAHTATSYKTFVKLLENRLAQQVEKLEESERMFKQAQAITHIGNFSWDLKSNLLIWTDELYRIYGLAPGSGVTDEIVSSFNHPDDDRRTRSVIQRAMQDVSAFDFYYRILLKDGSTKMLRAIGEVIADDEGQPASLFGTVQDVTQQKAVENELLQNQLFIKKIADATPLIITSYNTNTNQYIFVSAGLKTLLGYEPELPMREGINFFVALVHPDDLPLIIEKNSKALTKANVEIGEGPEEIIIDFQYRMKHKNGDYRWFHTFGTVFDRDQQGRVQHVLNMSIDITNQVEAEKNLIQQTVELMQSNSRLEEYAFIASHDLKEPLRKIGLFTDRLHAILGNDVSDEVRSCVEKIYNSSKRLQEMVHDLLEISQLSSKKSYAQHDLQSILDHVVHDLEHKVEEVGAVITTDSLPKARVIASQFRQLFQNLLSNALKFVRPGVVPQIRVTHSILRPEDVAHLNLRISHCYLQIKFEDNGIGFDNAFSEKIFGIFQRLHRKEAVEGTGMGLAICKKIVQNHDGIIQAEGKTGAGATFTIIIPS
jgi:PAS domain S-box-containing protein